MTTYMWNVVESKDNNIYLTESQIESEVRKNWDASLKNMHDKVSKEVKTNKTYSYPVKIEKWIAQMSELEVLDNFADSIDNLEFY